MYTPHQYQHPGYDPHLWRGSKCHQKGTLETYGGVLRSQEVPLGLGGGPREKHDPIRENWGSEGESKKEENEDEEKGFEDGPGENQREGTLLSTSC